MNGEDYKAFHKGYAGGNAVVEELAEILAEQTTSVF